MQSHGGNQRPAFDDQPQMPRWHRVRLAVTPLSPRVAGLLGMPVAYHSSILVDAEEYSFADNSGLVVARVTQKNMILRTEALNCASHKQLSGPSYVVEMGESLFTGAEMATMLGRFFQENSYDLLLKNCNHFSDCALFFLLGRRLPDDIRVAEQLCASAQESLGLISIFSLGAYEPNQGAKGFNLATVLDMVAAAKAKGREQRQRAMHPRPADCR
ncbi:unnamed protein product [Polarella glacialis]|uniref:PPPDE domain-containing protein n=1 Tax=Polarella glacialis TaxID=89957 RepID=A0A813L521_POLGL|nr:unnamed protein product [Polarella glacialis]